MTAAGADDERTISVCSFGDSVCGPRPDAHSHRAPIPARRDSRAC